jgi:hypothetical protein
MRRTRTKLSASLSLAVAIVVGILACNNSGSSGFPFSGPGCTAPYYSNACWSCQQRYCNAGCAIPDCAPYFECVCACQPSDDNCSSACIHDHSCVTCLQGVGDNGRGYGDCSACASACYPTDGGDDSRTDETGKASTGDGQSSE